MHGCDCVLLLIIDPLCNLICCLASPPPPHRVWLQSSWLCQWCVWSIWRAVLVCGAIWWLHLYHREKVWQLPLPHLPHRGGVCWYVYQWCTRTSSAMIWGHGPVLVPDTIRGFQFLCSDCYCPDPMENCDVLTGQCSCPPLTTGRNCTYCVAGTYGDPVGGCMLCSCGPIGTEYCHNVSGNCMWGIVPLLYASTHTSSCVVLSYQ